MRRPGLAAAVPAGLVAGALASEIMPSIPAGIIGWDVAALVHTCAIIWLMSGVTTTTLRQRARMLESGRWIAAGVATASALIAATAIVLLLVWEKGTVRAPAAVVLGAITILISWAFIHVFFAQEYAHDHWLDGKGIEFPGNDQPGYSEFLYFAFVIGMTAQVSDATTTSAGMRRLVLLHSIFSFFFNAAILALAVNLAATLV